MKNQQLPPRIFHGFFRWYCHPKLIDHVEGDLLEAYLRNVNKIGKRKADLKFIVDVFSLFRREIIKPVEGYKNLNSYGMYKNYLKTAWRNISRRRAYAAINVSGLALGIGCALLIFSLVTYHLSFDNFHHDSDRIYRFVTEEHRDQVDYSPAVPPAFGNAFRRDYTFGEKIARLSLQGDRLISIQEGANVQKYEEDLAFADPEYFDIFNFPLASGSKNKLLTEPNTAIISERIAKKYFGNEPAIGKVFRFDAKIDFTITGVLKNIPENTDLPTEIFLSYSTMKQYNEWYASDDAWGGITTELQTFVRLRPGVGAAEVEEVLPAYVKKFRAKSKNVHHYKLQPLSDIHFNSKYGGKMSKTMIWALSMVGILLIFTACLNFINLATAQAVTRAKEVGVRKVLGSIRRQLFWQFTTETGVIVIFAALLAFAASYLIIPYMNIFFNIHLALNPISDIRLLAFLLLLIVTVTLFAGAYPGLVLSRFQPVHALKGKLQGTQSGNFNIRRGLIIGQFIISQVLLIGLIVMFFQMKYINQKEMGFDHHAVVMISTGSRDAKLNTLKTQFEATPHVDKVSLCFAAPAGQNFWGTSVRYDNHTEAENFSISFKGADEDYLSTFNIDLVAGRNLTPSDTVREFLVNEKAVVKLGLSSPEDILGKTISVNGGAWSGPVVGVVKDFHGQSLHSDIEPIFMATARDYYSVFAVKINMADAATTLAALEKTWSTMYPELIYHYDFLDDQIADFYREEKTMMTLTQIFSAIALIIGCLGLYGLVSFMAVQKTKEIGIRKVLGGSIPQILWIFGKEFSSLVMIAFFIAAPIAWFIMSQWLSTYAFREEIGFKVFVLELAVIFGIVFITAAYRSFAAAKANPVDSLKSE